MSIACQLTRTPLRMWGLFPASVISPSLPLPGFRGPVLRQKFEDVSRNVRLNIFQKGQQTPCRMVRASCYRMMMTGNLSCVRVESLNIKTDPEELASCQPICAYFLSPCT